MDIILFIQEYISYTPFLGKYLITYFSPDKIFISSDIFIRNQHTSELMMIGGITSCLVTSIIDVYRSLKKQNLF